MKKNLTLIGMCMVWLIGLPLSAYAVQTIDAPHLNLRVDGNATESCSYCHFSSDTSGNAIVPGSTCVGCHTSDSGGYTLTTAPLAATHQSFPCETCHNPHVSQQYGTATPLVSGTLSSITPGTTQTTMTVSVTGGVGNWQTDPTLWTSKSVNGEDTSGVAIRKLDRGLILWVTDGTDNYSFEVKDTSAYPTITVNGVAPALADGTSFELHYGQLLAHKVTAGISYRYGTSPVSLTDANNEPEFVNSAGTDGICQTCHDTTLHYTNTAVESTHHVGETCTKCHLHSNGFSPDKTNCVSCHTTYPEPPNTGMHTLHAGTTNYNFPCEVCHKGGMSSWNPGSNGAVQIGFNLVPIGNTNFSGANTSYDGAATGTMTPKAQNGADGYLGENDTTITTNGSFTCSNIYCHSNGYSAGVNDDTSGASIPSKWTSSTLDTTPKWDGSSVDADGNKCNNCHDNGNFPAATFTTSNYKLQHGLQGYNVHWPHALFNVACMYCHNNTVNTSDSSLITNKSSHANGLVNVKSGGVYGGSAVAFTYDPTTHSCQGAIQCHSGRTWITVNTNDYGTGDDVTYPVVAATPNVRPVVGIKCYNIDADTMVFEYNGTDSDAIAPLKNAAFGGHDGSPGLLNIMYSGGGQEWKNSAMKDSPVTTVSVTHVYSPADIIDTGSVKQSWYYARVADNDPSSQGNMIAGSFAYPPVLPGWNSSQSTNNGWIPCDYSTSVDPMANTVTHGTRNIQITTTSSTTLQIDDYSYDPDSDDPNKASYYGAGHTAADNAFMHIYYFGSGQSQEWVELTGTTDGTTGSVYGKMTNYAPQTGARRIIRTFNVSDFRNDNDGSGNYLYVFVEYIDNHWKYINPPPHLENSGYVKVYFP